MKSYAGDWFHYCMLIGSIRDIASAEFEAIYYAIEPSSTTELGLDESRRLKGRGRCSPAKPACDQRGRTPARQQNVTGGLLGADQVIVLRP